jgi:hypothetical protein
MMEFEEIPKEKWPTSTNNSNVFKVFRNKKFIVQIIQDFGCQRITVNRTHAILVKGEPIWSDGISWDQLQGIKDAIGYADKWCIECFPPQDEVVNIANMRHLWVLSEPPKFGWHNGPSPT